MPLIRHSVEITPLNAIWLVTFGLCGLFVSLFNIDWHRHQHTRANGLLVNLLMATAVCTVIASNLGALVVMAEIMALCGVFLTGCSASGKLWFCPRSPRHAAAGAGQLAGVATLWHAGFLCAQRPSAGE